MDKKTSVLHIVPYSFNQPEHKFLGSTKDILCRTEYFRDRNVDFEILAPSARSDRALLPELSKIDLYRYQIILIEKADYPLSMIHIKKHAPQAKILLRGHNAEFYHHIHRVIARLNRKWHDGMQNNFKENIWDLKVAIEWGNKDCFCSQLADAVLSITEWERLNYWNLFTSPSKVFTVPSFLTKEFITSNDTVNKRELCVCYMSNGINPMLLDSGRQFNSLVESLPDPYGNWEFAITGNVDKKDIDFSGRVKQLGFLDEPFTLLREAKCIAILSDFGFGFKTKILDAISQKCWTIVTAGLYNYLPDIIKPFCIPLESLSAEALKNALQKCSDKFPPGDPNTHFRDIAFDTLDHQFGFKDMDKNLTETTTDSKEKTSEISDIFKKTMREISSEFEIFRKYDMDCGVYPKVNDSKASITKNPTKRLSGAQLLRKRISGVKHNFLQMLRKFHNFLS